jgi:Cu+-exporting ATPase
LGLATPMSIMVGVGRGAHEGVLIKDAAVLEIMERIDTLVVDKTGTLTEGKPVLVDVKTDPRFDAAHVLGLAASVEQHSEHPLAAAIIRGAKDRGISVMPVADFKSTTGGGVQGIVADRTVAIGKRSYLESLSVSDFGILESEFQQGASKEHSVILVAVDGKLVGVLSVSDPIKKSTPDAIKSLHAIGLKVIMMTGDNETTARSIGGQLGIDEVYAGVAPEQKHDTIKKLRASGRHVAMAGDGINDAPALAAADVGIAMGTGTDVAIESAGVTLVKGDLRGIVKAIRLSRATMRNIRQNLFFAFIYNALGVPIAAGLLYPFTGTLLSPMLAAAAMSVSSVSVIANALKLRSLRL